MKPHRIMQLFGLYGMLFLIPLFQFSFNQHSSEEEYHQRKQIFDVVKNNYYQTKIITCTEYGSTGTGHDCEKGVYQDLGLKMSLKYESQAGDKKNNSMILLWVVYYIFALFGFFGAFFEYRKEHSNSKQKMHNSA